MGKNVQNSVLLFVIEKRNSNEAEIDKIIEEVDEPIDLSQIPF